MLLACIRRRETTAGAGTFDEIDMAETLIEKLTKTDDGKRLYEQERVIQELTDLICQSMDECGMKRIDLAKRIGKTRGNITSMLDGATGMASIRSIVDVFWALGKTIRIECN